MRSTSKQQRQQFRSIRLLLKQYSTINRFVIFSFKIKISMQNSITSNNVYLKNNILVHVHLKRSSTSQLLLGHCRLGIKRGARSEKYLFIRYSHLQSLILVSIPPTPHGGRLTRLTPCVSSELTIFRSFPDSKAQAKVPPNLYSPPFSYPIPIYPRR